MMAISTKSTTSLFGLTENTFQTDGELWGHMMEARTFPDEREPACGHERHDGFAGEGEVVRENAVVEGCGDDRGNKTDQQECSTHEASSVVGVAVWTLHRRLALDEFH